MKRRRILLAAAAGLLLLLGGLAVAVALIPERRVAEAVASRAESALGQPVAIDRVGIVLFPLPGVRLSGLAVGAADSSALASIDRAELRVRILPLFAGRVVVKSLDLEGPRIAVEIDRAGVANFPVFEPDTSGAGGGTNASIAFAVQRIRISDGGIRYTNLQDGTRVRLDGWNQELSVAGAVREGTLASLNLDGELSFDNVDLTLPGAVLPARDLALRVRHDATLDLAADRMSLDRLELDFDGVAVAGSGRVDGVNSGRPSVHLNLSADGLDAGRLMAWVPDSLRALMTLPDGRPVGLRGSAAIRAAVDGTVAPDTLPAVEGLLTLANVAVTLGDAAVVENAGGQVTFSLDSVVARFDGQALGQRFNAGLAVRNPAAPVAVLALSGQGDLGRLAPLGLLPDTLELGGQVRIDLRAQVPVTDPATSRAVGTIDASGVTIAGMGPDVRVPTATANFDGGRVRVDPFRLELGPDRSAVSLTITADGWIPAAVDTTAPLPTVSVALQGGAIDLDALMGETPEPGKDGYAPLLFARLRDRTIDGRRPEEIAEEMGLSVPPLPPVDARFEAHIEELVRNGIHYTRLEALARANPEAVTLERLRFGLMGGTVEANGRVEPVRLDTAGAPVETRITGRFGLTNVGAQPFFDILTPFKDHLSGRMDMSGTVGMSLDRTALPERGSLRAGGDIALSDGRVANWAVLRKVTDRLGITAFDTLRFNDWSGSFRIAGPRVTVDQTAIRGGGLDAAATGWFDFGGELDVTAEAALTAELAGRSGAIGQQILTAAPGGRVPVGLRIHGPVEDPAVSLDLAPARQLVAGRAAQAVDQARQEAEERARAAAQEAEEAARNRVQEAAEDVQGRAEEAAGDVVEQAADRATGVVADHIELPDSLKDLPADSLRQILGDSAYALLPDSVRLRADSLQQAIRNAIRERLRRLLPGGGGGGGGGIP